MVVHGGFIVVRWTVHGGPWTRTVHEQPIDGSWIVHGVHGGQWWVLDGPIVDLWTGLEQSMDSPWWSMMG